MEILVQLVREKENPTYRLLPVERRSSALLGFKTIIVFCSIGPSPLC